MIATFCAFARGSTTQMNRMPKYVVSNSLTHADWNNTTVISGDIRRGVEDLKAQPGGDLVVYGSPDLVDALLKHDLVDEYRIMIEPILLGGGKRVFPDGGRARPLELVDVTQAKTGVLICTYRPAAG